MARRRMRERLGAAARRAGVLPRRRGVILMYHRIADEPSDPYGLCVSPRHFDEHLHVIRELGRPMRIAEFAGGLRGRSLPRPAICLTFDDGYADNMEIAVPLLGRHDVPALVFVTTGDGGRVREFWWDELERVFLQPGELPERLEIGIAGRSHAWTLAGATHYTDAHVARHGGWHLLDQDPPTARHGVLREVYDRIQPLGLEERTRVLDALLAWAGHDARTVRPGRRTLQPEEVATLAGGGIMDVGAHTVNHPALPAQGADVQRAEIASSKRDLESWTGRPVTGFAYPYGLHDGAVVGAARGAGFAFACAGDHRAVTRRTDPFRLPRIEAPRGDGDALGRILQGQLQ